MAANAISLPRASDSDYRRSLGLVVVAAVLLGSVPCTASAAHAGTELLRESTEGFHKDGGPRNGS